MEENEASPKTGHWRSSEWPNRHAIILYASIIAIFPVAVLIIHYSRVGDSEAVEIIQILAGTLIAIAVSVLVLLISRTDAKKLEDNQDKIFDAQQKMNKTLKKMNKTLKRIENKLDGKPRRKRKT